MEGFAVLLRKEWRETRRTSRLVVVGAVFLVFGSLSPLLAKLTPELIGRIGTPGGVELTLPAPVIGDAVDQFLKNPGTCAFVAILPAMGVAAREKERGTARPARWPLARHRAVSPRRRPGLPTRPRHPAGGYMAGDPDSPRGSPSAASPRQ